MEQPAPTAALRDALRGLLAIVWRLPRCSDPNCAVCADNKAAIAAARAALCADNKAAARQALGDPTDDQ